MVRKNEKKMVVNYENSILKSNEFSMAKINHGLTLNQMQLLAYAIYSTQKNSATEFHKADFEKKFGITKYQTSYAKNDAKKLLNVKFGIEDLENDYFEYWNVFQSIKYKEGVFGFKWSDDMIPHILELKEKYITTDLTITAQFKSSFSWTLYDYIKAHYGYWHKPISKDALMRLFGVENKKTYQNNTGRFKKTVLDVAIAEINALTEFEIRYDEVKKGKAIVAFDLIWSNGINVSSATERQITEIQRIVNTVFEDVYNVDLNNPKDRQRAIEIIEELESFRKDLTEPMGIRKERADFLIQKGNQYLRELEQMLERKQNSPKVSFYNWLEERE